MATINMKEGIFLESSIFVASFIEHFFISNIFLC